MARWWCALWVPERKDVGVAPVVGGMFPDGVMGWWVRGSRSVRALDVEDGKLLTNVERTERLIHAVVDASMQQAAKELIERVWLPSQLHSIEIRPATWWPRAGAYPITGRSPARWKVGKVVAGG